MSAHMSLYVHYTFYASVAGCAYQGQCHVTCDDACNTIQNVPAITNAINTTNTNTNDV